MVWLIQEKVEVVDSQSIPGLLKDRTKQEGGGTQECPDSLLPGVYYGEVKKLPFAPLCQALDCVLQHRFPVVCVGPGGQDL